MKKLISIVALAAISFGTVYAHGTLSNVRSVMQTDTTKKKKTKPVKKDSTKKKDSTNFQHK